MVAIEFLSVWAFLVESLLVESTYAVVLAVDDKLKFMTALPTTN